MFKLESKVGPLFFVSAIILSCALAGALTLSTIEGPTVRQRDAIGSAATAQAVDVTREAARHAVEKEAAETAARELEATRYVTWSDVSPVLTRQAILNKDLEAQLHLANRAMLATPAPAPAPVQARANWWLPWLCLVGMLAALVIREWGKTQRARETVTVRTPARHYEDIEI